MGHKNKNKRLLQGRGFCERIRALLLAGLLVLPVVGNLVVKLDVWADTEEVGRFVCTTGTTGDCPRLNGVEVDPSPSQIVPEDELKGYSYSECTVKQASRVGAMKTYVLECEKGSGSSSPSSDTSPGDTSSSESGGTQISETYICNSNQVSGDCPRQGGNGVETYPSPNQIISE